MPQARKGDYKLQIDLDASAIKDFKPDQRVKVVAIDNKGVAHEEVAALNASGKGTATLIFPENPGALRVLVGPENASAEEIKGLQTISANVSARHWQGTELKLPMKISAYYWWWWFRWCRDFTIRGHVICPDGSPAPGAQVCAYDVDWWFIYTSTQLVGCDTTDINGAFEITFRWCCGWWPWWWWRSRVWQLDPVLTERVSGVLRQAPDLRLSPLTSSQPTLAMFNTVLADKGLAARRPLAPGDVNMLEQIRGQLLQKLPAAPELERLRIWPWWPWWPWWDCTPDIIFKVTQDCHTPGAVIVDEGIGDTRWNIPNPLDVNLVANEKACCRGVCHDPLGLPCPEGECLVIEQVCGDPINEIGGNLGAPAVPAGYLRPGAVLPGFAAYDGDRAYAGIIPVVKNFGDMLNVDYYEIEFFSGGTWNPLPPGAAVDFWRRWMLFPGASTGDESFPFTSMLDGAAVQHTVVESREHFEATHYGDWWPLGPPSRFWIANENLLVPLDTSKFADGTYHFRVVGWQLGGAGELVNRRVLPVCGTEQDNDLVLTFDNRVLDPMTHDPSHNCGQGVHICTQEPDTHIIQVRVNGNPIGPCETVDATTGTLEVDFLAHDPDAHLAVYSLVATYGVNQAVNLLQAASSVTPLVAGTQTGWNLANPVYGTYGVALAQGATAPDWGGGTFTVTVPMNKAFPIPCCYQLELRAWKRTVVGGQSGIVYQCQYDYAHWNLSEFTIGVGVCPPAGAPALEAVTKD
jgi:hypothetical protein